MYTSNYQKINQLSLQACGDTQASELQGAMAAFLCMNQPYTAFQSAILADAKDEKSFKTLFDETESALDQEDFSFNLFLPDEEANLNERAEAFTAWCQGFLSGLGLAGFNLKHQGDDIQEGVHDLTELAQLDVAAIKENNEQETLFEELLEFSRSVVVLIYLNTKNKKKLH